MARTVTSKSGAWPDYQFCETQTGGVAGPECFHAEDYQRNRRVQQPGNPQKSGTNMLRDHYRVMTPRGVLLRSAAQSSAARSSRTAADCGAGAGKGRACRLKEGRAHTSDLSRCPTTTDVTNPS